MSDLYSYLTQTTLKSKKKKNNKLKKRRLKWGAKGGKYNEKQSKNYNMKEDKLDKLLTLLIAQTNQPNKVELKRQQDLLSDFSIASTLQADEIAKSKMGKNKSKKNSTEEPATDKQILAGRMEEYNTDYEQIEQGYKSLADPDPCGSVLFWSAGSGSASMKRIRIRVAKNQPKS